MVRTKCDGCSKYVKRANKTIQPIDHRLPQYQAVFETKAVVGAKFCAKCCLRVSRSPNDEATLSIADINPPGSKLSTSDETTDSSDSDPTDVDFVPPSSHQKLPKSTELIEMPYKRVVATEAQCFVCGSTKGRSRVSPQLRVQVFLKRRLFVPKNNRCCESHLIQGVLCQEDLKELRQTANTSLMDKQEIAEYVEMLAEEAGPTLKNKVRRRTRK